MTPLDKAIEAAGGRRVVAEAFGVRYQANEKWQRLGRLPAERVLLLEKLSGVPRHKLRPDLYPVEAA